MNLIALEFAIAQESPAQADVVRLIAALDAYQLPLYPDYSNQPTDISRLTYADVIFAVARSPSGEAVGCAGILLTASYAELKRMYVQPAWRGHGVGSALLRFLEGRAVHNGAQWMYLETGIYQPESIGLYERAGYKPRGAFGGYVDDGLSVFMGKALRSPLVLAV